MFKYIKLEYVSIFINLIKIFIYQIFILNKLNSFVFKLDEDTECSIYFDNIYFGGASKYFNEIINNKIENKLIIRIQNFKLLYKLTVYDNKKVYEYLLSKNRVFNLLININYIVNVYINGLITNYNLEEIFEDIKKLKKRKCIMLLHDYFSICPSYNLINNQNKYCYLSNKEQCTKCFFDNKFISKKYKKFGIDKWRNLWNSKFYNDICDEIIVFSESSKQIISLVYPNIINKITVKPHRLYMPEKVIKYSDKKIKKDNINIAFIGNLTFQKGGQILDKMSKIINKLKQNINIKVIGKNNYNNIYSTGKYNIKNLSYILKKEKIDLIFISSIWPETFSYTTSEAIYLEYPVACFNIGAQAEKVSNYSKGLVISEIDAEIALDEIFNFFSL